MQGHTAPAGADLEQVITRAQVELAADTVQLPPRRALQGFVVGREDRRGVHQVVVEEQAEKFVAEIVVRGDVASTAFARIPAQGVHGLHRPAAQLRPTALHAVEQVAIAYQQADQADQVVAAPVALHVGLAGADGTVGRGLPVEPGMPHVEHDVHRVVAVGTAKQALAQRIANQHGAAAKRVEPVQQSRAQETVGGAVGGGIGFVAINGFSGDAHRGLRAGAGCRDFGWEWKGRPLSQSRAACQ